MNVSSVQKFFQQKKISFATAVFVVALLIVLPAVIIINENQPAERPNALAATPTASTMPSANPLAGANLAFPHLSEQYYAIANQWQSTRPTDAALMRKLGDQQKAVWHGEDWAPANTITASVNTILTQAATTSAVPVLVAYSIPKRDCSSYSGGGSTSIANYKNWVQQYANGINHRRAIVILEPDGLAQLPCLSAQEQTDRLGALQFAVTTFKAQGANVYIDAGNARWTPAATMAQRLNQAGIVNADGFSVNVSNFFTTEESVNYGNQISSQSGGKHFVIDTSRNGLGPYMYPVNGQAQWCNPPGRALGLPATTNTGIATVDAFLWIKTPGQSDGACTEFGQNDPNPGTFMPEYALGLAQRASWITSSPTPIQPSPTATSVTPTTIPTPVLPTSTTAPTSAPAQLLQNGSFENGLTSWNFNSTAPAVGKITTVTNTKTQGTYSAKVVVTKASTNRWYVQLMQNNLSLIAGKKYTVSFWAKASKNLTIENTIQQAGGAWTVYSANQSALTTNWKLYTYSFTAPTTATAQLAFNLAKTVGTVWIDNVAFTAN